ncbi:hypothetical protein D5R93_01015 [Actinomyces lilanjuaniae]|uniref:HD Cas3-type domain-containing protein n=1 Tax=Actinomyces lilanjuaniae TaxID=2321394 RepID=A0ABN5PQ87_9ACTO|nr:hypothetical protein [Actinomyces lilanjuaniae]AYD88987.1 hypothetical protein D5R93_01015 [Actinomyces lilanjuaniae]
MGSTDKKLDLSQRHLLPQATLEEVSMRLEQLARRAGSEVTGPTTAASPSVVLADLAGQAGRLPDHSTAVEQARAEVLPELADELKTPPGWLLETEVLGKSLDHPWLRISLIRPPEKEPRPRAVALAGHNEAVGALAERWARAIGLPPEVVEDVALAGRWHDEGKGASESFQAALAMREDMDGWLVPADSQPTRPLAKSALPVDCGGAPPGWRAYPMRGGTRPPRHACWTWRSRPEEPPPMTPTWCAT